MQCWFTAGERKVIKAMLFGIVKDGFQCLNAKISIGIVSFVKTMFATQVAMIGKFN
jgi:hypothetical protein